MGTRWALGVCAGALFTIGLVQCGGTASRDSVALGASGSGGGDGTSSGSGGAAGAGAAPGDCVAPDDGARFGYHTPDPGDTWLPDCENPLNREYWRVFQKADGDAYTMPRADGWEGWPEECERDQFPIYEIGQRYGLCDGPLDAAGVRLVNAMAPVDALTLTRTFHSRLVFVANEGVVTPFAIPSDVLDACLEGPSLQTGPLAEVCEFEIEAKRSGSRPEAGPGLDEEQAVLLAAALNELYGIEGDELCYRLMAEASHIMHRSILANRSCSVDEDCTGISNDTACSSGCGAIAAVSGVEAIEQARSTIDASICEVREQAGCEPVGPIPCILGGGVACNDGVCGSKAIDEPEPSNCGIAGESTCADSDSCTPAYAWIFDEATGECTGRGFVECVPSDATCSGDAGFLRAQGRCFWTEHADCDAFLQATPDPSCGEGDPSMSGCGIR